jgi:hypothetical protein
MICSNEFPHQKGLKQEEIGIFTLKYIKVKVIPVLNKLNTTP